jgi:hypothetical protein
MSYLRKICPTCGSHFVVLKEIEEKAKYCTLKCLLEFDQLKESGVFPLLSA